MVTGAVLHNTLPAGQAERAAARLPSMQPVEGPWLQVDDMYAAQMEVRRQLISIQKQRVYAQLDDGLSAARSFLEETLDALPDEFEVDGDSVCCPDGECVVMDWDAPLISVGSILQQDVCILERHRDEHVLTGAILCFPASWTLAEKIGKPLIGIHATVNEYDANIARRVQRFFDGVQQGRPMWRANLLRYTDPDLFQPRLESDPRPVGDDNAKYLRSERQTVLRLRQPNSVAFVIHTVVVET